MKEFDKILQYHIDNKFRNVSKKQSRLLNAQQNKQLQACLDLHYRLNNLNVKPAFGRQALHGALAELDGAPAPKQRFQWSTLKLGATAMASLLVVIIIGGFSWLGTNQPSSELSQDNVKPNGTVENLQNLNLADAENDTNTIQSDTDIANSAQINLARTSNIDEAVDENL